MSDVWTQWEGHLIDGSLPLQRFLGASDHSGVFLTEPRSGAPAKAALKLVPAIPSLVEAQLSHWRSALDLQHPRLIRLHECGRCQLGERHFLFLVMEYADQTLAEVLPHRALTGDEAREMLIPTLDALSFLHARKLVQGQVKPTNILVVGDQVKLASDTIRPASEATANISTPSVYDAPEMEREIFTTAVDIWALGATLVESLTQRPPSWARNEVELPPDFAPTFAEAVRLSLSYTPARRPDVAALLSWLGGNAGALSPRATSTTERAGAASARAVATERPAAAPEPSLASDRATLAQRGGKLPDRAPESASESERLAPSLLSSNLESEPMTAPIRSGRLASPAALPREEEGKSRFIPAILGLAAVGVAAWAAVRFIPRGDGTQTPPVSSWAAPATQENKHAGEAPPGESARADRPPQSEESADSAPASAPSSPKRSVGASRASASGVVHEEIPKASKSARDTIHGHIRVAVRVTVDKSGTVVSDTLDDPGPSHYFARLATQAARKWKFSPAEDQKPRVWLLRFEFGREGTTAHAAGPHSR